VQIYCDFSGYTDMAIGLALALGIRLPTNFLRPYTSTSLVDFWRRWHITLSSWLRDYLYIPLGGNRHGARRTYLALMGTMLLGGLWHGANWTFVLWGAYHGLLLVGYQLTRQSWDGLPLAVRRALMFVLVVIGWVLFRAPNIGMAADLFGKMFSWTTGLLPIGVGLLLPLIMVAAALAHFGRNAWELRHQWRPAQALGLTALFALCLALIWAGQHMPFLYFQF